VLLVIKYINRLPLFFKILVALLFVSKEGWCLPPCSGQYDRQSWTNCLGSKIYANGDKYVGGWKNGTFHGKGALTLSNGGKYVGEFMDGKLHGHGTITFSNGDKYIGQLRSDHIYGRGTYKYGIDGRVILGVTENGTFPYEWEVAERIRIFGKKIDETRPHF